MAVLQISYQIQVLLDGNAQYHNRAGREQDEKQNWQDSENHGGAKGEPLIGQERVSLGQAL